MPEGGQTVSDRQKETARLIILGIVLMITAALISYAIWYFVGVEALHSPTATPAIKF